MRIRMKTKVFVLYPCLTQNHNNGAVLKVKTASPAIYSILRANPATAIKAEHKTVKLMKPQH